MDEIYREPSGQYKGIASNHKIANNIIECYLEHFLVSQNDKDIFKRVSKYLDSNEIIMLKVKIQYQNNIMPLDRSSP